MCFVEIKYLFSTVPEAGFSEVTEVCELRMLGVRSVSSGLRHAESTMGTYALGHFLRSSDTAD
jgi:hypothetical protein